MSETNVAGLPAKWRKQAEDNKHLGGSWHVTDLCNKFADELEAALSQTQPAAAQPADTDRLVRELDVALNGAEGAAPQASLCDVVAQVQRIARERGAPVLAQPAGGEVVAITRRDAGFAPVPLFSPDEWGRLRALPKGTRLYAAPPAAGAVPECPHRTRCDCLAACKYGWAGDGAQQEAPDA